MSEASGRSLGHYEIKDAIGKGGMGEVFRATDSKLGRDVALKMLPEALAQQPDRLARFRREAQVLAALNHPNIATLFGLEHLDGAHVLVMELVEGEPIPHYCDQHRLDPPPLKSPMDDKSSEKEPDEQ